MLWAVTRGHTGHAPPLYGWTAHQCRDDPGSRMADGPVGDGRENGPVAGVGQCLVARQSGCAYMARGTQSSRQAGRRLSHSRVSFADQESLAESHRAQMGPCKRAIAEPDRKLPVDELKHRICAYYDCELLESIAQKVA